MKKNHLQEDVLDRLAREPAGTDGRDHLLECPRCRQRYEYFVRFHEAFSQALRKPRDPAVERIAAPAFQGAITLRPVRILPDIASLGVEKRVMVLAAQGTVEEAAHYVSAATFISEPTKTLVRVVRDADANAYTLHVLSDFSEHRKHVVLGIGRENEQPIFAATDEKGIARVTSAGSIDWNGVLILLYPPLAKITVDRLWKTPQRFVLEGLSCEMKVDKGVLDMHVSPPEGQRIHHAVAVRRGGVPELEPVVEGYAAFPAGGTESITEIRLFG